MAMPDVREMDLFLTSYLPTTSFPATSLLTLNNYTSGFDIVDGRPRRHDNFIRLLQHVALTKTPILPLTWEPAFEKLGLDGAVGTVDQNLLNSKISLAFKRFKEYSSDPRISLSEFRDHQYEAIITELTVFSCPTVLQHPNIIEFVGLCFELSRVEAERRSWDFNDSSENLDEDTMIAICGEVAKGIHILHRNNIVHGDIKPSNILVATDPEQDVMSITVADFGFSRSAPTEDAFVKLTRSEPWDAPEWSYAEISLAHAKAMDIYSFGLICLWLFFGDETLEKWGFASTTVHAAFSRQDDSAFEELQYQKRMGNPLLQLTKALTNQRTTYNPETKSYLRKVFALSLEHDHEKRLHNMEVLVDLLCKEIMPAVEIEPNQAIVRPQDWHGGLQMENLFFGLESCDYRIHTFVTKALSNVAAGKGCSICIQNAAAQLVFCRAIGFGVDHGDEKDAEYLSRCGMTLTQVEEILQRIERNDKTSDIIMARLAQRGYRHDFWTTYSRDGVLQDAINYYRRAVTKRKALFNASHYSILRIQGLLLNLMRRDKQLDEAIEMALEMQNASKGRKISDQLEIKTELARLYASVGNLQQAEDLEREISTIRAGLSDHEKTSEKLDSQLQFARVLTQQGKFEDAIILAKETFGECLEELGELHTSTLAAQRCLARAYSANGQLQLAMQTNIGLVSAEERLISPNYIGPNLVQDVSILGVQYYRMKEVELAKECYDKVLRWIQRNKTIATYSVAAVNNCATELIRQGDKEIAIKIAEALLSETTNTLGPNCEEVALVMGNLAGLYQGKQRHHEAEDLERRVVLIRRETLGASHSHTIIALGNLRQSLLAQNKYEDAAGVGREELDGVAQSPTSSMDHTIHAAEIIANSLESKGAFELAIPFFETEMRLTGVEVTNLSLTSMISMTRAALCYIQVGALSKAKQMTIALLSRAPRASSLELQGLVSPLLALTKALLKKEWFPEAEQVLALASLLSAQQRSPTSATEAVDVESTIKDYLEQRNLDTMEVVFDPSKLS